MYSEYRFSPFSNVPGVCAGEDYCEGIFAGLSRGQRDFNLKVRCILVIMRNIPGRVSYRSCDLVIVIESML